MRVWIDTDVGTDVDDALALAFAIRHPELELVGASTVFGDVELRVAIVEALLERAGAEPSPVLAGLGKPLTGKRVGLMLGHEGQGLLDAAKPLISAVEPSNQCECPTRRRVFPLRRWGISVSRSGEFQ